jgi:hypothetical protein
VLRPEAGADWPVIVGFTPPQPFRLVVDVLDEAAGDKIVDLARRTHEQVQLRWKVQTRGGGDK